MTDKLRFGLLGAARITPDALVVPAAENERVELVAIAARDMARAQAFADTHQIPHALADYEALIAREDINAVYIGLPASLHGRWAIKALKAGKAVLCEKPLAANADEATQMVAAAKAAKVPLVEAFHWRYHPMAQMMMDMAADPRLGDITHAYAEFHIPKMPEGDIRFDLALGGGALMDLGVYPLQWLRHLFGEPEVTSANASQAPAGIDVSLEAKLQFGEVPTTLACSMNEGKGPMAQVILTGASGKLTVLNPLAPQLGNALILETAEGQEVTEVPQRTTYAYQLEAFVAHVLDGAGVPTGGQDAINNMRVVDAIYRAAGMAPRLPC